MKGDAEMAKQNLAFPAAAPFKDLKIFPDFPRFFRLWPMAFSSNAAPMDASYELPVESIQLADIDLTQDDGHPKLDPLVYFDHEGLMGKF